VGVLSDTSAATLPVRRE